MKAPQFILEVESRGRFSSKDDALRAIQATLETLGERIDKGEAKDLASQLPHDLAKFISSRNTHAESFPIAEFFRRVSEREGTEMPEAVYHSRVVLDVLKEAITAGELKDVLAQLPLDYRKLFAAGSEGNFSLEVSEKSHQKQQTIVGELKTP